MTGPGRSTTLTRGIASAILVALAAWLVVLIVQDPAETTHLPSCLWFSWTGLRCPGCGMTRAIHHLLHGRIGIAMQLHPLVVLLPVFAAAALGGLGFALVKGRWPKVKIPPAWVAWALIGAVAALWIYRTVVDLA